MVSHRIIAKFCADSDTAAAEGGGAVSNVINLLRHNCIDQVRHRVHPKRNLWNFPLMSLYSTDAPMLVK